MDPPWLCAGPDRFVVASDRGHTTVRAPDPLPGPAPRNSPAVRPVDWAWERRWVGFAVSAGGSVVMHDMVEGGLGGRTSPQTLARIGGVLYLIIIVGGGFSEMFVRARTIVPGDPAATAANILSSELLWRVGIAGEFLMLVCTVALALGLYVLLRPVSRG